MYKEGQIIEARLSESDADNLNKGNVFICSPSQIVGYEKPFDWSTVKPGMAFQNKYGSVLLYVNKSKVIDYHYFEWLKSTSVFKVSKDDLNQLTRAPEHDIKD